MFKNNKNKGKVKEKEKSAIEVNFLALIYNFIFTPD